MRCSFCHWAGPIPEVFTQFVKHIEMASDRCEWTCGFRLSVVVKMFSPGSSACESFMIIRKFEDLGEDPRHGFLTLFMAETQNWTHLICFLQSATWTATPLSSCRNQPFSTPPPPPPRARARACVRIYWYQHGLNEHPECIIKTGTYTIGPWLEWYAVWEYRHCPWSRCPQQWLCRPRHILDTSRFCRWIQ